MPYQRRFSPEFEKELSKIKKKDSIAFRRICKKIKEVLQQPEFYKPLKYDLKGLRRFHAGSYVIMFSIKGSTVEFIAIDHHDNAYQRN